MNLRKLDLNLLLVFEAIYAERSISRAAEKLNLSQPAVSNALTRLRESLNDPLFERTAQGMMPTARAKALKAPIQKALGILELSLRGEDRFDHQQSDREFVIAIEDYAESVILPQIVAWLTGVAPNIRLTIRSESSATLKEALRDGTVDMAIDYFALSDKGYHSQCLITENLVSLVRKEHPRIGERLTLQGFVQERHAILAPRHRALPMIDLALSKRGLRRKVALIVPHFRSMPALVQNSDLICTLPRRMAHQYAEQFGLKVHAVPIRMPDFPIYLTWHEAFQGDRGHEWLRDELMGLCAKW